MSTNQRPGQRPEPEPAIDPRFTSQADLNQLIIEKLAELFYGNHPWRAVQDLHEIFDLLDNGRHRREAERRVAEVDLAFRSGYWPPRF